MDFISDLIQRYAEEHTTEESTLLNEINRETHLNVLRPRMLSGHLQGQMLSMFTHLLRPLNVLEIGTYTGYSALCIAEGMQEGGKLVTIDINAELEDFAREKFDKSPFKHVIDFRIGNALDVIPELDMEFDLVFIDADKKNYLKYYQLVLEKLSSRGAIIADNVLWSGKVVEEVDDKDEDTIALKEFNDFVHQDQSVINVLFPVRDGLMLIRKR